MIFNKARCEATIIDKDKIVKEILSLRGNIAYIFDGDNRGNIIWFDDGKVEAIKALENIIDKEGFFKLTEPHYF